MCIVLATTFVVHCYGSHRNLTQLPMYCSNPVCSSKLRLQFPFVDVSTFVSKSPLLSSPRPPPPTCFLAQVIIRQLLTTLIFTSFLLFPTFPLLPHPGDTIWKTFFSDQHLLPIPNPTSLGQILTTKSHFNFYNFCTFCSFICSLFYQQSHLSKVANVIYITVLENTCRIKFNIRASLKQ